MFLKTVVIFVKTSTRESLKYGMYFSLSVDKILLLHKLGMAGAGSELTKAFDSDRMYQDLTSR